MFWCSTAGSISEMVVYSELLLITLILGGVLTEVDIAQSFCTNLA